MFFKKKNKTTELLELNQEKLVSSMNTIGERLNSYKGDDAMEDVRSLIRIGKNLAVLNCASAKNDQERIFSQAKAEVYNDLQHFIDVSIERKVQAISEGKKQVSGTLNTFRRTPNQAGSAF